MIETMEDGFHQVSRLEPRFTAILERIAEWPESFRRDWNGSVTLVYANGKRKQSLKSVDASRGRGGGIEKTRLARIERSWRRMVAGRR